MNIKLIEDYELEMIDADPGRTFPRYDFGDIGVHVFWHNDKKIIMIQEDAMDGRPYRVMKCECDEDDIDMGNADCINKILVDAYLASEHQDNHPQVKMAIALFGMKKDELIELRFSNGEVVHLNKKSINWMKNAERIDKIDRNRDVLKEAMRCVMNGTISYDEVMNVTGNLLSMVDIKLDHFFDIFGETTERERMLIAVFEAYYVYATFSELIHDWINNDYPG